jgi:hypothetical protein
MSVNEVQIVSPVATVWATQFWVVLCYAVLVHVCGRFPEKRKSAPSLALVLHLHECPGKRGNRRCGFAVSDYATQPYTVSRFGCTSLEIPWESQR